MKEETCMLQDEINQKEKGCLQVAARSASRTFCSAKPAGGLRHMQCVKFVVQKKLRQFIWAMPIKAVSLFAIDMVH